MESHLEKLGIKKLKPLQEKIINNLMNNKDVIGTLHTGFGKSICFQIPYLITKKFVIVVSPLIALMEDQKNKMSKAGIPTNCFFSASSNKLNWNNFFNDISVEKSIMYFSPENLKLNKENISKLFELDLVGLIAIDECHCISTCSSYRPIFQEIGHFLHNRKCPILAVTATATEKILSEVKEVLNINNAVMIAGGFNRSNLQISIIPGENFEKNLKKVKGYIKQYIQNGRCIIYSKTKDETDEIAKRLNTENCSVSSYHAGYTTIQRNKIQDDFMTSKCKIIVATCAFGMGVDIPDIRLVIHIGIPTDMEDYYQAIGRAGRDGNISQCIMFKNNKDFILNNSFNDKIEDYEKKKEQQERTRIIHQFVDKVSCRMKDICAYFNDDDQEECGHCDNCINKPDETVDMTREVNLILETVIGLKNNSGIGTISKILTGSNAKGINDGHKKMKTYNSLPLFSQDAVKTLIYSLCNLNYFELKRSEDLFGVDLLSITQYGRSLSNKTHHLPSSMKLKATQKPFHKNDQTKKNNTKENNNTISKSTHDITLAHKNDQIKQQITNTKNKSEDTSQKSKGTHDVTLELLQQGHDIKKISHERNLSISTIENHVVKLVKDKKWIIEIEKSITDKINIAKTQLIKEGNTEPKLREIRDKSGIHDYLLIKLVLEN